MAQKEVWRAYNSTMSRVDTYTLTRSDTGIVTEYEWASGAGDPVSAPELSDRRRIHSKFINSSSDGILAEWGWSNNLTSVPTIEWISLTGATPEQATSCFYVNNGVLGARPRLNVRRTCESSVR